MDCHGSTTRVDLEGMLADESVEPKALPLSLLEEITDSFSQYREIGAGGFAVVYRGVLETGTVAVKKLSNACIQETEFQREVECLMSVRHKNIVRFLGYCADTQGSMQIYEKKYVMADVRQRLLCFEYVPNGSLHDYITDASCGLAWRKRYQIIKGVCEGLNYLHNKHVLHLDLKPANILMDDNMEPKIADFGLSRCFDEGQSLIMATQVIGTLGYMPPEFDSRAMTRHYDIYSLGVIIIEILTGKKWYQTIENVLESWRNRLGESLEDTEFEQIQECADIGKECTKRNPERRPRSVQHIIDRLKQTESVVERSLEMMRLSKITERGLPPVDQRKLQFPMFELDKLISSPSQAQEQRMWYQQTDDVAYRKTNTTIDIRLLAMYAEASGIVGIDGPMAELIDQLMDGKDELKVLSIVGSGGLGKTTLAKEIYRKLQGEFLCRAFVSVSKYPNIRKLLSTMISQNGFVAPSMENLAESELIGVLRNLILLKTRLHDMMRDLILQKSREENFVTVVDDMRDIIGHQDKIHRLSFLDGALDDRVPGSIQLSQTSTLAIFGTCSYLPPFQLFKHLQVLGIEITVGFNQPQLLDFTEIHNLFHLRYLKIIAEGHKVVLPSKIGSMQQLETFEINATITLSKGASFEELPPDLIHLSRLLHLILPDDVILPNGIGNMKSLRTLHCFNLHNSPNSIKGLGKLTNLTNLKIIFDSSTRADDEIVEKAREVMHTCLGELCNLKYLYVHFSSNSDACFDALSSTPASFHHLQIFHGYKFSRVPEWIVQLHSLYDLSLTVKQVFEEDVGILAHLPSVINLELFILGIPEDKIIIYGCGFPVLKHFTFSCSRISCLAFVPRAMPRLEKLELHFNAKGWDRYNQCLGTTLHLLEPSTCQASGKCMHALGARVPMNPTEELQSPR